VLFKALELQAELQEALDVDAHRSSLAVTKGVAAAASTVFMATCLVANPATAAAASIATASAALVAGYRLVMARRLLVREKWILKSAAAQFSSSRFSSSLSSSQSGSQQLGFQLGSPPCWPKHPPLFVRIDPGVTYSIIYCTSTTVHHSLNSVARGNRWL
jgi:hypothetical protein